MDDEGEWVNILPSRRWALVRVPALGGGMIVNADWAFEPTGSRVMGSWSTRWGVVPRTAPSFRVERMRRVRWWESRTFAVGGGEGEMS
jgi:hypothetical protein